MFFAFKEKKNEKRKFATINIMDEISRFHTECSLNSSFVPNPPTQFGHDLSQQFF